MRMVALGEFMPRGIGSIDPAKFRGETFELWSIPAFDEGKPEILLGSDIGSSKKRVEPNDVLLSRIVPHIRRSWIVKENKQGYRQIASSEWITFRSPRFYPTYLRHFLISNIFHAKFIQTVAGVGGSLLRARPEGIREIEIPLPPLDEQKRIAAILDQVDTLRRLRQRAIDRLNELGGAIFYEMFGDLTKIPIISLGELVDEFRYGTSNKSAEKGYPALRIPNIIGGVLNLDDVKLVPVESAELQRLRLKAGDVLFVRTNGNPDYVGRCAIFDPDNTISAGYDRNNWIYASYLIRARLKETQLNSVFLCEFLSTLTGHRLLRERSKTSAGQFNINTEGLGSIPVPVPALEKQVEFALKCRQISLEKRFYLHSKAYFDKLFSSLQHRAFTGELTSKDVERELAIAG